MHILFFTSGLNTVLIFHLISRDRLILRNHIGAQLAKEPPVSHVVPSHERNSIALITPCTHPTGEDTPVSHVSWKWLASSVSTARCRDCTCWRRSSDAWWRQRRRAWWPASLTFDTDRDPRGILESWSVLTCRSTHLVQSHQHKVTDDICTHITM
jgi:hypothetical protein